MASEVQNKGLNRYLSPMGVWALAFGCSVGWGAFVMPGTTFLPIAGPLGTALGILIGAAVMFVIGANYHYMMNRHPDAGGTYTYAKKTFGFDHGFLSAWFLVLTYISIIWANASALALIARHLFGDAFQFGFHYTIFGYDVYLGEVLLSVGALVIFGLICAKWKRLSAWMQIVFALVLIVGILVCFGFVMAKHEGGLAAFSPAFVPGKDPFSQVVAIIALAPWAFIGFESVSHSAGEFKFSHKKSFLIMALAITAGAIAYIALAEVAAATVPDGFTSWTEYIAALGSLEGVKGLPTFFAVENALGSVGITVLGVTVLGGILTGLIGNMIASSRLIYSMAQDDLLPSWFGKLGENGSPKNAILFITAVSLVIPFFGRTAIGWIVDVTTIGATIAYGYASASAFKRAKADGRKLIKVTGMIGMIMSAAFSIYLLVPNFLTASPLATESYLILAVWSILGVLFFRSIFKKDKKRRLGKSTIVWIALLFLIFFISLLWMTQSTNTAVDNLTENINAYHRQEAIDSGLSEDDPHLEEIEGYIDQEVKKMDSVLTRDSLIQMGLIIVTLIAMFSIYSVMQKREIDATAEKIEAEQRSQAKSSFLSNMSHDIRTPMNAITGYTALALAEPDVPENVMDYLKKIDSSSQHLLALINDLLDMSRIESGKTDLDVSDNDIAATVSNACEMFVTQMQVKRINYTVDVSDVTDKWVKCDSGRISRILLNLVSNAFKFTQERGSVGVTLKQTGSDGDKASYELRVKDTGIGMSEEFAEHVFEAFERERSSTVDEIQGTGLGMAITKNFIDLMGGTITVNTKRGEGTEFVIKLTFEKGVKPSEESTEKSADFTGVKLLIAEDNPINLEIAKMILSKSGFIIDSAEDGKEALDKISASAPGDYDAVLMDINMPNMNGLDATRAIRALDNAELANIPIIAMTASALSEDVQAALGAGMNAHISKPIELDKMMATLAEVLSEARAARGK